MTKFLTICYEENIGDSKLDDNNSYEFRNKPFANSPIYGALIEKAETLADGTDVNLVYQIKFALKDSNITFNFNPGDVIGILPENDVEEVNKLLDRLILKEVCHKKCSLKLLETATKKNAIIPKHLPPCSTLFDIFLRYIDIRVIPKKSFLKNLIKYTTDIKDQEKLEFICSASGSEKYSKLLEEQRSLLSLLNYFPSCCPPIEFLLENSAPLSPRFFSIASSPLSKELCIIFFVLQLKNGLKGICTGWMERLIKNDLKCEIPIYFRKPSNFQINLDKPSVLVATGTGLAPLLGFLQHKKIVATNSSNLPETWLFYGCRYSTKDYLCRKQLRAYLGEGILTRLYTAFSRDTEKKEYVQHKIFEHQRDIMEIILNKKATVFICGNKTMVKEVKELLVKVLMDLKRLDRMAAEEILSNTFIVDSWV